MKNQTKVVLLCLLAEVLNYFTAFLFFDVLHAPLFMDTIFTVAITFYCGLVPGVLVGIFHNIITTLTLTIRGYTFEPLLILFGICGALVAFATWFFARHKAEFRISRTITILYLVLIALFSSLLTIISAGTIDFVRFTLAELPDRMAPIKAFTDAFRSQNFSLLSSCFFAQIPISVTDRLITTFAGYGVYRLMVRFFGNERW